MPFKGDTVFSIIEGHVRKPLEFPKDAFEDVPPQALDESSSSLPPAIQLFVDRAADVKRGFTLDDSNREAIAQIVDQLDGIPLAIELAASRCSAIKPQQILERMPRRFDLLKGRRKDASARQATLRGAIDWSWNLLEDYEKSALAQCSVFQNGFFLEAAESVIDLEAFDDAPFEMDVIEALVEKSLLVSFDVPSIPGEARYRMLESIRQYAGEKLEEVLTGARMSTSANRPEGSEEGREDADVDIRAPDHEPDPITALLLRHAEHYVEYALEWNERIDTADAVEALDRMELELENLIGIQDALEALKPVLAARAIQLCSRTLQIRGPWNQRIGRLEQAFSSLEVNQDEKQLHLQTKLAFALSHAQSDCGSMEGLENALAKCRKQETLLSESDDEASRALRFRVEHAQFLGSLRTGAYAKAGELIDRALESHGLDTIKARQGLNRSSPFLRGVYARVVSRGSIYMRLGEYKQALACYAEAEAIYRELGYRTGVAGNVGNRGIVHQELGEYDRALECYAEAEAIDRELGNHYGVAIKVSNRGVVHFLCGEYDLAMASFAEAEAIFRALGNQYGVAICVGNRGDALRKLGRLDEAWLAFDEAATVYREISASHPLTRLTLQKALVLLDQNRSLDESLSLAQKTKELCAAIGIQRTEDYFNSLATLAVIEKRLGLSGTSGVASEFGSAMTAGELLTNAKEHAEQAKALGEELKLDRHEKHGPKKGEITEYWQYVDEVLGEE